MGALATEKDVSPLSPALAELLKLRRPCIFIDLETTGFSSRLGRIVEVAMVKVHPDGSDEGYASLVNPECKIPWRASEVHGIYDEHVRDQPVFSEIAGEIEAVLRGSDIGGHNAKSFDVPFLDAELAKCGRVFADPHDVPRVVDTLSLMRRETARTKVKFPKKLGVALEYYGGRWVAEEHMKTSHEALSDVLASMHILGVFMARHGRWLGPPFETLLKSADRRKRRAKEAADFVDEKGTLVKKDDDVFLNVGKYKGKRLSEVANSDPSYLRWMLSANFPPEALHLIAQALECPF